MNILKDRTVIIEFPFDETQRVQQTEKVVQNTDGTESTVIAPVFTDDSNQFVRIPIVSSISITHAIGVGEMFGLTNNILQAWHAKLVEITMIGSSYIGAFQEFRNTETNKIESLYKHQKIEKSEIQGLSGEGIAENIGLDETWNNLVQRFMQYQVDISNPSAVLKRLTGTDEDPSLKIFIANDVAAPYIGLVKAINGTENVSKPFVIDFNISFVGVATIQANKTKGESNAARDKALVIK